MNEINFAFVDSNCWFNSRKQFYNVINQGFTLAINITVIYEFIKVIDHEINVAKEKKRIRRVDILQNLKDRFPNLLENLNVEILNKDIKRKDIPILYQTMAEYELDVGDALILLNLKYFKIKTILTDDNNWKRVPDVTIVK